MLNEQELIQQEMEKTRGSLAEKLEALEEHVTDTVASTTGAVQETTHSVQETVTGAVDAVKETVAAVTDKVEETMSTVTDKFQETVKTVSDSFNLRLQMERHPWVVLGGAVAAGYLLCSSLPAESESMAPVSTNPASPPPARESWGDRPSARNSGTFGGSDSGGLWSDAISHLRDLGVSYLMGLVRDLAKQELPEVVGQRVAEEVDALTAKMGTQPIPGPVLQQTEPADVASDRRGDSRERKSGSYRGRSSAGSHAL